MLYSHNVMTTRRSGFCPDRRVCSPLQPLHPSAQGAGKTLYPYSPVSASGADFLRLGSAERVISTRKSCKKHMPSTVRDSHKCGGSLGWMPPGRRSLQARLLNRSEKIAAKRAHRSGDDVRYVAIKAERDGILASVRARVANEILQSGRCPKCHGTGIRERKQDQCPVCNGTGKVIPDIGLIGRQFGAEAQEVVRKVVDAVQIDKSRCLDVIGRRAQMEKDAA